MISLALQHEYHNPPIYNDHAAESAAGQFDIFSGGVKSKEDILKEVLNIINNGTETERKEALAGATERRKEAAGVQENGTAGTGYAGGGAAGDRQGNLASAKNLNYQLSDEVDDNGRQFVLTSSGKLEFGVIGEDTGLTAAPILLSEGIITNPATNDGYGLVHIEARHGDEIRRSGYASVIDFIEEVAKNYEVIREGKIRDGIQTYILQLTDKHNNTLMVELSGDGTYWNINTAGIFKTSYGDKRDVVYNRHTTDNQPAETDVASLSGEPGGTTPSTSMDATTQQKQGEGAIPINGGAQTEQTPAPASVTATPQNSQGELSLGSGGIPISRTDASVPGSNRLSTPNDDGKDTNNPGNGQEKVAGDGWPDYPGAVRVELPPKLKRMLKEATGNRKKLLKEAIEDIGDNREALEMLEDDEPRTLEEVVSLLLRSGGRRPIRLLMDDVDDGSLKLKGVTSYFLV